MNIQMRLVLWTFISFISFISKYVWAIIKISIWTLFEHLEEQEEYCYEYSYEHLYEPLDELD